MKMRERTDDDTVLMYIFANARPILLLTVTNYAFYMGGRRFDTASVYAPPEFSFEIIRRFSCCIVIYTIKGNRF